MPAADEEEKDFRSTFEVLPLDFEEVSLDFEDVSLDFKERSLDFEEVSLDFKERSLDFDSSACNELLLEHLGVDRDATDFLDCEVLFDEDFECVTRASTD